MKSVAPSCRLRRSQPLGQFSRQREGRAGARVSRLHRRARPVGRQLERRRLRPRAAPPVGQLCFQHLAPAASRAARRRSRRTGSAARAAARAVPAESAVERGELADSTPIDQPSVTMWCSVSSRTWSSVRRRSSWARKSGPARQVERASRLLEREALSLGLALRPGKLRQIDQRNWIGARRCDQLHAAGRPPPGRWCAAPRAGRTRAVQARASAARRAPRACAGRRGML